MWIFKKNSSVEKALSLVRLIAIKEGKLYPFPAPIEKQVFLMFCNRTIIDSESVVLLAKKGYYGSAYSLVAVLLRNLMMYASLVSDKTRIQKFWDEEVDTYQVDPEFKKAFGEFKSAKVAKKTFGDDAFNKTEFDKLLYGSCYIIRRCYSKKETDEHGVRSPVITMGSFLEEEKRYSLQVLVEGVVTDFLGIFFTDCQKEKRYEYVEEIEEYYKILKEILLSLQKQNNQKSDGVEIDSKKK